MTNGVGDIHKVVVRNRTTTIGTNGDGNGVIYITRYREYVNPAITDPTDDSKTLAVPTPTDMLAAAGTGTDKAAAEKKLTDWANNTGDPTFDSVNTAFDWKHSQYLATSQTYDKDYDTAATRPFSSNMYIVFTMPKEYYK
jgi:hypothetical protein